MRVGGVRQARAMAVGAGVTGVATSQRLDALVGSLANYILHRFVQSSAWLSLRALVIGRGLV